MIERAVYIVKPEAFTYREMIHDMIRNTGLRIAAKKELLLPIPLIDCIYPELDFELRKATHMYMRTGLSEIGIVEGKNVFYRLGSIAGSAVDPSQCEQGTIRNIFGLPEGVRFGKRIYFRNGFHRSKNIEEARLELAFFEKI